MNGKAFESKYGIFSRRKIKLTAKEKGKRRKTERKTLSNEIKDVDEIPHQVKTKLGLFEKEIVIFDTTAYPTAIKKAINAKKRDVKLNSDDLLTQSFAKCSAIRAYSIFI